MQLPSGQLLLNLIKAGKKGVPRANAFLRTILNRAIQEETLLADSALPLRTLKKAVHSGVPGGPRTPASLEHLNPKVSNSELKVSYTSPSFKLAKKFDKGGGVLSGSVEAGRFAYLNKPPSPRTLKNLMALYGHDLNTAEGRRVYNELVKDAQDQGAFFAKKGRHNYKLATNERMVDDHVMGEVPVHETTAPPPVGYRPTLGTLLGLLDRNRAYGRNPNRSLGHIKKYGSPGNAVEAMKEMGFHGSRDVDWFYVKNAGNNKGISSMDGGSKFRDIEEVHLFNPKQQALDAQSPDMRYVEENESAPLTKLMRSLGVTNPPPTESRWRHLPSKQPDRSKRAFNIDTSQDSLFKQGSTHWTQKFHDDGTPIIPFGPNTPNVPDLGLLVVENKKEGTIQSLFGKIKKVLGPKADMKNLQGLQEDEIEKLLKAQGVLDDHETLTVDIPF